MKVDHHLRSFSAYEAVANVIGVRFAFGAAHQVDFVKIGEAFHHVMRERIDARFDRAIGIDWDVASDHFEPEQLAPLFFEDARQSFHFDTEDTGPMSSCPNLHLQVPISVCTLRATLHAYISVWLHSVCLHTCPGVFGRAPFWRAPS